MIHKLLGTKFYIQTCWIGAVRCYPAHGRLDSDLWLSSASVSDVIIICVLLLLWMSFLKQFHLEWIKSVMMFKCICGRKLEKQR